MEALIHIANVLYLLSYLMRDILWLRVLTVVATSFLIPYFYFRPDPLMQAISACRSRSRISSCFELLLVRLLLRALLFLPACPNRAGSSAVGSALAALAAGSQHDAFPGLHASYWQAEPRAGAHLPFDSPIRGGVVPPCAIGPCRSS